MIVETKKMREWLLQEKATAEQELHEEQRKPMTQRDPLKMHQMLGRLDALTDVWDKIATTPRGGNDDQ